MPHPGTVTRATPAASAAPPRAELIRALGAVAYSPPPATDRLTAALGLPAFSAADHTAAFVLSAPPHAAIHLGAEGKLGGHGLDRVEGFWRAAGCDPPADADHLGVLLMCYADMAHDGSSGPALRVAESLFGEHIWCWAPGYLRAVAALGVTAATDWAELTAAVLAEEHRRTAPAARLPLALRNAPGPLDPDCDADELLDAVVSPVRCGFVLTHQSLSAGAAAVQVGYRRGERRFALRAMLSQDRRATLGWLAGHARTWVTWHGERCDATSRWWAQRAGRSAQVLAELAGAP